MIGGIAANNASGMCCGTTDNSYKTVTDMKIIFHDGSLLDTSDPASRAAFLAGHRDLVQRWRTSATRSLPTAPWPS